MIAEQSPERGGTFGKRRSVFCSLDKASVGSSASEKSFIPTLKSSLQMGMGQVSVESAGESLPCPSHPTGTEDTREARDSSPKFHMSLRGTQRGWQRMAYRRSLVNRVRMMTSVGLSSGDKAQWSIYADGYRRNPRQ